MEVCDLCTMYEPNYTCKCCDNFVVCNNCFKDNEWKTIIKEHEWNDKNDN